MCARCRDRLPAQWPRSRRAPRVSFWRHDLAWAMHRIGVEACRCRWQPLGRRARGSEAQPRVCPPRHSLWRRRRRDGWIEPRIRRATRGVDPARSQLCQRLCAQLSQGSGDEATLGARVREGVARRVHRVSRSRRRPPPPRGGARRGREGARGVGRDREERGWREVSARGWHGAGTRVRVLEHLPAFWRVAENNVDAHLLGECELLVQVRNLRAVFTKLGIHLPAHLGPFLGRGVAAPGLQIPASLFLILPLPLLLLIDSSRRGNRLPRQVIGASAQPHVSAQLSAYLLSSVPCRVPARVSSSTLVEQRLGNGRGHVAVGAIPRMAPPPQVVGVPGGRLVGAGMPRA